MHVPLFVERVEQPESMICRKIVAILFSQRIAPLPFAANAREFSDVFSALQARHTPPAILIINSCDCSELLTQIDRITPPNIPMLLFQRQSYSEPSLSAAAIRESGVNRIIEKITRRKSVWAYGGLTSDAVARSAAELLALYFLNGDFASFEQFNPRKSSQRLPTVKASSSASLPAVESATTKTGRWLKAMSSALLPATSGPAAPAKSTGALKAVPSPNKTSNLLRAIASAPPPGPVLQAAPPPEPATATVISGLIGHVGVSTLLTMFEMEKKTGRLTISRPDENALLHLRGGRIIDAMVDGLPVPLESQTGAESVYYVLGWKNGAFEFMPCEVPSEDRIGRSTTELLMEGARRHDEKAK